MRSFLIGLVAGLVLSALRAPAGLELLQFPATVGSAAMAYRAAALLVVGVGLILGLRSAYERFSTTSLLVGTGVGFQLHWQLIGGYFLDRGFPARHVDALLVGLAGVLALAIVGRKTGRHDQPAKQPPPDLSATAGGHLTSIALCGAGSALLLEGLARHVRWFGGGLACDDSVFGTVFLSFAIFGAFAFGRPFLASSRRPLAFAIIASCSGLAAWVSLRVIGNLATHQGLERYLRGAPLEADFSQHGMLSYDALVAAPILVLPAFIVGSLIALLRRPTEVAALLLGAGGGLVAVPQLLQVEWNSVELALLGAALTALGALFSVLTATQLTRGEIRLGALATLVGLALCQAPARTPIHVLSPWEKREVQPLLVREIPEGLLTVEPDAAGNPFATLNRRALTSTPARVASDLKRIEQAFAMLGEARAENPPRVLFVGQLDQSRALYMTDLGAGSIDRTAAWAPAMGLLEEQLFGGPPTWFVGQVLELRSARQKLEAGEYDLVIVAPLAGPAPTTRNLASPPGTTVVVWMDAAFGLEDEALGQHVLLSAPFLTELFVGVVRGPSVEDVRLARTRGAPGFVDPGTPLPNTPAMRILGLRKARRVDLHLRRFSERLASAERTPGIAAGLAAHFKAQTKSSPFLTEAQKIELDPDANDWFATAACAPEPDALAIELIESLAYILSEQRQAQEIERVLTRPAARHQPWPALEIALAHASLEFLDPEAALKSLARAHSTFGGSPVSLAMWAEAQEQVGDDAGAVKNLERALELAPHQPQLERRLAIALQRAGDGRGPAAIRRALEKAPQDRELLQHQVSGPYPPLPGGYHPLTGPTDQHHE